MAGAFLVLLPLSRISIADQGFSWIIPVALLVFALGAPWVLIDQWLHQRERNARAQQTYASLNRGIPRLSAPLVFYLRSFDWDEKFGNEKMRRNLWGPWVLWLFINPIILLFFVWQRLYQRLGGRLESLVHRAASQSIGPMIDVSLGRAQGRGFGRVSTTDALWKQTATTLLNRADLVFMMFSDTAGTSWELEQLQARGRLARTVFLVPPAYALSTDVDTRKYQLERDYRIFSERMRSLGYATPPYQQGMAFRVDADPNRVSWVCFDKDFDKGGTSQLRAWLQTEGANLGAQGLTSRPSVTKLREAVSGFARLGVAAAAGLYVASYFDHQTVARERLVAQCGQENSEFDDETIVASCSTMIAEGGGVQIADINVINNRGLAYLRLGDTEHAIADFGSLIARNSADPVAFSNRATARYDHGNFDAALEDYDQVIALLGAETGFAALPFEGILADAYGMKGSILLDRGDNLAAIENETSAIHIDPQNATLYMLRARANLNLGNYEAVKEDCTLALAFNEELTSARVFRAIAHTAAGDDDSAVADLDQALALPPDHMTAVALRTRGEAHIRLGHITQGEADIAAADARESATATAP